MKKVALTIALLIGFGACANAYDYVKEGQEVYYNPAKSVWSEKKSTPNDLEFKNRIAKSSGGYNEYVNVKTGEASDIYSNAEFIYNNELIGINSHDLNFVKYSVKNDTLGVEKLTKQEVQRLYPEYEILLISDFRDNKIVLKKPFFETQKYILLNDTDKSFYKYSYKPSKVASKDHLNNFITVKRGGKITFSHYGEDSAEAPKYTIRVKRSLIGG